MVCVVEILTTDGISFSAKSAKDSGTDLAFTKNVKLKNNIEIKKILNLTRFILLF